MLIDRLQAVVKTEVVDFLRSEELVVQINGTLDVPGLSEELEAEVIRKVLTAVAEQIEAADGD